jgi:hypothetical protein
MSCSGRVAGQESPSDVGPFLDDVRMNLYDLLAEAVLDRAEVHAAEPGRTREAAATRRPHRPHTTVTATIETTDERMINLRHAIAGP